MVELAIYIGSAFICLMGFLLLCSFIQLLFEKAIDYMVIGYEFLAIIFEIFYELFVEIIEIIGLIVRKLSRFILNILTKMIKFCFT